jgi:hypothetical protein
MSISPLFYMAFMIQFIWLIERVLSLYAALTNGLMSILLSTALASAVTKTWISVKVLMGGRSRDSCSWVGTASEIADWTG